MPGSKERAVFSYLPSNAFIWGGWLWWEKLRSKHSELHFCLFADIFMLLSCTAGFLRVADLLQDISLTGEHIAWEIQLIKDTLYNHGRWDYQILVHSTAQWICQLPSEENRKKKKRKRNKIELMRLTLWKINWPFLHFCLNQPSWAGRCGL